jgi:hypothetical protein
LTRWRSVTHILPSRRAFYADARTPWSGAGRIIEVSVTRPAPGIVSRLGGPRS